MNQVLLRSFIRNLVLEAFSSGTIAARTRDFQKEDPTVTPEEAKYYLDRFSDVQSSPHVQDRDIQRYSWRNRTGPGGKTTTGLKDFIDSKWSTRVFYEPVSASGLEPVYESENGSLQVFLGDRREKCVTFRKNFERRTGKTYSWCISRSDASNLFTHYRLRGDEPVFYYLFDFERTTDDPLHACVIYVTNKGEYWLSDANNAGDKKYSWSSLVRMMPKTKDLQGVFKYIPVLEKERDIIKELMSDEQFSELTRDQKEDYISAGHRLSASQLRNLWGLPDRVELINKYCNHHENVLLPLDIWMKIPGATRKVVSDNFRKDEDSQTVYRIHYHGENKIEGSLRVRESLSNVTLPENFEISGDLIFEGRVQEKLPSKLRVGGVLKIRGENITDIPPGIKCNGIDISNTSITKIDANIFWDNNNVDLLNIDGTNAEIPDDLRSVRTLSINMSSIEQLPSTLKVMENLHAIRSNLVELPQGFSAKGKIDLSVSERIIELPPLTCGELHIAKTNIEKISPGTQITGDIIISSDTKLTSLPLDLKLGGKIRFSYSGPKISEYPFYQDYLKIKRLNKTKQEVQSPVRESLSLLKRVIRETLHDLV